MDKINNLNEDLLGIQNEILKGQLDYLKLFMEHVCDLWSEFDLRGYDVKLDNAFTKAKMMTYQNKKGRLDKNHRILLDESSRLDERISQLEKDLVQYRNLDSTLLTEFRMINEDLDCQDLLIEISKDNTVGDKTGQMF